MHKVGASLVDLGHDVEWVGDFCFVDLELAKLIPNLINFLLLSLRVFLLLLIRPFFVCLDSHDSGFGLLDFVFCLLNDYLNISSDHRLRYSEVQNLIETNFFSFSVVLRVDPANLIITEVRLLLGAVKVRTAIRRVNCLFLSWLQCRFDRRCWCHGTGIKASCRTCRPRFYG